MKRTRWVATIGVLFVIAGMSLLFQSRVLAQDATPEPYTGMSAPHRRRATIPGGHLPCVGRVGSCGYTGRSIQPLEQRRVDPRHRALAVTRHRAISISWVGMARRLSQLTRPRRSALSSPATPAITARRRSLTSVTFPSGVTIEDVGCGGALYAVPSGARFDRFGQRSHRKSRADRRSKRRSAPI